MSSQKNILGQKKVVKKKNRKIEKMTKRKTSSKNALQTVQFQGKKRKNIYCLNRMLLVLWINSLLVFVFS